MSRAAEIFEAIEDGVRRHVKNVRGRGCLIGLEFDAPVAPVIKALRERGILSGSSMNPNAMRLMPPLNTENEELTFFVDAFKDAVKSAN
jgi:acetylornithine/succinyldiaminopimelate/putrescine aminotransferase